MHVVWCKVVQGPPGLPLISDAAAACPEVWGHIRASTPWRSHWSRHDTSVWDYPLKESCAANELASFIGQWAISAYDCLRLINPMYTSNLKASYHYCQLIHPSTQLRVDQKP